MVTGAPLTKRNRVSGERDIQMAQPTLKQRDQGDEVKRLQGILNRVGALLLTDDDTCGSIGTRP